MTSTLLWDYFQLQLENGDREERFLTAEGGERRLRLFKAEYRSLLVLAGKTICLKFKVYRMVVINSN